MLPGNSPVVILKEGTQRDSGKKATQNNIAAAKAIAADTDDLPVAGFALADAASGDLVSVLTGSGIIIYANVDGDSVDVAVGDMLTVGESGALVKEASGADKNPCAVALEANAGTEAQVKVLVF